MILIRLQSTLGALRTSIGIQTGQDSFPINPMSKRNKRGNARLYIILLCIQLNHYQVKVRV